MRRPASFALLLLLPCLASAQGELRGTVYAPAGRDVAGTLVIACHLRAGRCDDRSALSKAVEVKTRGDRADYVVRGLAAGEYIVIGLRDVDGDGAESAGDWAGHHAAADGSPRAVTPPARGVDLQLSEAGASSVAQPAQPAATAPRPPVRGGRALAGIWFGVGESWDLGRPTKSVGVQLLTFYPDGRVLKVAPFEGLAVPFDFEARCGNDTPCGAYRVRGKEVQVDWATGWQETYLKDGADGLRLVRGHWRDNPGKPSKERRAFRRLDRLGGLRLDGTYAFFDHQQMPRETITFTQDGRFSEKGLIARTNTLAVPFEEQRRREALGRSGGAGTYRFADNTLELRYDGGQIVRFVVFVPPGVALRPAPRSITLNGVELSRLR